MNTSHGAMEVRRDRCSLRNKARQPRFWIRSLAVMAVVAVGVCLVAPSLFLSADTLQASQIDEEIYKQPLDDSLAGRPFALVHITTGALDSVNRVAKATVSISVRGPDGTIPKFYAASGGSITSATSLDVKPEYAQQNAILSLNLTGGRHVDIPMQMAQVVASSSPDYRPIAVDLPADTSAALFPNDVWEFDGAAHFLLPLSVVAAPVVEGEPLVNQIPMGIGFLREDRLEQWQLSSRPVVTAAYTLSSGGDNVSLDSADFYAIVERPSSFWVFVYVIALTPMIIGLAYMASRNDQGDSATALSLAATLLSLLAIRQVVTPSDIQGLTRLDRLLGFELVVLVMGFTFIVTSNTRFSPVVGSQASAAGNGNQGDANKTFKERRLYYERAAKRFP